MNIGGLIQSLRAISQDYENGNDGASFDVCGECRNAADVIELQKNSIDHYKELAKLNIDEAFTARAELHRALQEKLDRENPQPLTLEELKLMHRQPIYIITEDEKYWGICIVDKTKKGWHISFSATGSNYGVQQDEYGETWIAYRHKPDFANVDKIEHIGEATNMVEGE